MISPLAFVSPGAKIGENVTVHPFAYIDQDVEIGSNCTIMPHASIMAGTRMGENNQVFQGAVLGAVPQDFRFSGKQTGLTIGNGNVFRENVVVNRANNPGDSTSIGNGNCLFEGSHVAHDTRIADNCIVGSGTKIAGNCRVDSNAIFSASVIVDPGCRIGCWSMTQGGSHINRDIPPYIVAAHNPVNYFGINSVVLAYNNIPENTINQIVLAYSIIYQCNTSVLDAVIQLKEQMEITPEIQTILDFIKDSKLGIVKHK